MGNKVNFRGCYCRRCHTYYRLYQRKPGDGFSGTCPGCNTKTYLPLAEVGGGLFVTGGAGRKAINIWDNYCGGEIIGQVDEGSTANVLNKAVYNGVDWYEIRAGKVTGWVSGRFIRKIK